MESGPEPRWGVAPRRNLSSVTGCREATGVDRPDHAPQPWTKDVRRAIRRPERRPRREGVCVPGESPVSGIQLTSKPLPRPSDDEIAAAIRTSMEMNSLVDADDVEVKVNEGAVVLTGTVLDPLAKWTAEDLVDRTAGVIAVENNLRAAHEPLPGVAPYTFPRGLVRF